MRYSDLMKKRSIRQYEFSQNQPKPKMKVVTKIERVQPYAVGTDKQGNLIWEGRAMPEWQRFLFKLQYFGDFLAHWSAKQMLFLTGIQSEGNSMTLRSMKGYGKKKTRKHEGD